MNENTPADEFLKPISQSFCKEREEVIQARRQSGLEDIWKSAREQYAGVDEINKGRDRFTKSEILDGPITTMGKVGAESRSTVFVNITRPYTDAGTARVADILLPAGRFPFDLQATPVSDTSALVELAQEFPEIQALPFVAEKINVDPAQAQQSIAAAKKLIDDWLTETKWQAVVREQIIEAGKVGTGVMKGPTARPKSTIKEVKELLDFLPLLYPDDFLRQSLLAETIQMRFRYQPGAECVKVENLYPDPGCGSDLQSGKFIWEEIPSVSERQLEELKEDPSYFAEQIDACIEEGPKEEGAKVKKKGFKVWVRTGDIDLSDLLPQLELEEERGELMGKTVEDCFFGTVSICNDRIIKLAKAPLDSKVLGYWPMLWEPREGSWAGIGIPEQIETPQRGLNGSVRALMDNMAYSVGPQVLERDGLIEPKDGQSTQMHPYKHWKVKTEALGGLIGESLDPKMAMTFLEFPNYLNEIMPVIQFWLKMAEDTTGLPLILQGQATTDAVGVSQQLMNNSTTNLRLRIKYWDDHVCKPFIDSCYEWAQLYGPASVKGDAVAKSLGSSVLLQKELQQQALLQIGDRVIQPIYGKSPSKWMDMFLEGFQIDPRMLDLTKEEQQKLEAAQAQPDPKVEAATIMAQVQKYTADLQNQFDQLKLGIEANLKGLSIQQAKEIVDTQMASTIAAQAMKREGDKEKEMIKQGSKAAAEEGTPMPGGAEPSFDEAMDILGLGNEPV